MNWNNRTDSISGKTVVEKMLLKKLLLDVAIRPDLRRSRRCAPT